VNSAVASIDLTDLTARIRAFLSGYAEPLGDEPRLGSGMFDLHTGSGDLGDVFEPSRAFQSALFAAGLAGLSVPVAYGGQGLDHEAERLFAREAAAYRLPHPMPLSVGLGLAVPTLLAHGSEAQKHEHIEATLAAREVWCQLFSEPEAGSDLAGLRTRALRRGDGWLISGQKVWTSFATFAQFGLLLARTDPDAPKHRGISMFMLPMDAPGVEIRPLREMTGGRHFNEVFLNDVVLPADAMIGGEGEGWKAANTTLGAERGEVAGSGSGQALALVELARQTGRSQDPTVRQSLMHLWTTDVILRALAGRARAARTLGRAPGPEGSVLKLLSAQLNQRSAELACELVGAASTAWPTDRPEEELFSYELMYSRMYSIAGGTNEIQRNIIGERVLGLPREPR